MACYLYYLFFHIKVHKIYSDFLAVESIDPTLAYVQYMKFCRRAEGIKVRQKYM